MDLQAHGVTSCPTCQDRPCQVRMVGVMPTHPHLSPPIADAPVIPPRTVAYARTPRVAPTSAVVPTASPAATASTRRLCIVTQVGACPTGMSPQCPPPDGCSSLVTLQRRVGLMPPASTGQTGRAIPAAATWARLGRGAPRVSTDRDTGTGLAPRWGHGHGVGTAPGRWAWGWDKPGEMGT